MSVYGHIDLIIDASINGLLAYYRMKNTKQLHLIDNISDNELPI